MWEKILPWIGGIFAGVGVILIFCDVIGSIKRRDMTKTNIVGLVFLAVGVLGYVITDLVLPYALPEGQNDWPALASLVWILFFWIYVIVDACVTMKDIGKARRKKKGLPPKPTRKQRKQAERAGVDALGVHHGVEDAEQAQQHWEEISQIQVSEERLEQNNKH